MRAMKGRKAQTDIVVKLVVALVVIGMLIYIGYKYILGTGEKIGGLSQCEAQGKDAKCQQKTDACAGTTLPGLCEKADQVCCIPRTT